MFSTQKAGNGVAGLHKNCHYADNVLVKKILLIEALWFHCHIQLFIYIEDSIENRQRKTF